MTVNTDPVSHQKSVFKAYLCLFFGGIFGAHHLYLGRDYHALVTAFSGVSCYGLGLLFDFFLLPRYVEQVNQSGYWTELLQLNRKYYLRPRLDITMVSVQMFVGALFRAAVSQAIPYDGGYWVRLWVVPLAVGCGVWAIGKIYHVESSLVRCCGGAGLMYGVIVYLLGIPTTSFPLETSLGATIAFWRSPTLDYCPEEGRITRGIGRKKLVAGAFIAMLALQGGYYYHNATVLVEGVPVKLRHLIRDFLDSPAWYDAKSALRQFWEEVPVIGVMNALNRLLSFALLEGGISEEAAYEMLGVSVNVTSAELKKRYRHISLQYHPDKVKPEQKEWANTKFMEYKEAYEVILKMRNYRKKIESAKLLKEISERFQRFEEKHSKKGEL